MQTDVPLDPERETLLANVTKKLLERNAVKERLRKLETETQTQQAELQRVEAQIHALMSIGHYIGEVLKRVDDERFIVKSISGARHLVGYKKTIPPERLRFGARVALEVTTLTIVKLLPREVDPQVYTMRHFTGDEQTPLSFQAIGGLQPQMRQLREVVELPLTNPELFRRVGIRPPRGVLLYGPPGTGKTLLAKAIAANVTATFLKVAASAIVDKYIGESARVVREMFTYAREHPPCILFIDEVDAIGGRRIEGSSSDREIQRTLMELLHQMDGFDELAGVKLIMATNRPDTLDPALMRPGRLDRKIEIGLPNGPARLDILRIHARPITKRGEIDYESLVNLTEGFNGADLRNVCTEAGMFAIRDGRDYVENEDFNKAARKVVEMKRLEGQAHAYSVQ